ncbi:MAG: MFS transporter [Dehalococcoidia bacterium]
MSQQLRMKRRQTGRIRNLLLHGPAAPSKWLTLTAACLGLMMLMIDTFVVNVAFPAIGRNLHAGLTTAEWTVSGYVLVVGVFPIATGRLGDLFGRRRIYLAGLLLFVAASIACGASQGIVELVAFRVLQGLGAAAMFPGTLSIVTQAFPPEQRGLAIGVWGGVSGLGLIAGPILGGLLVHGDSWRWIFFVNVPVGIIAIVMAFLCVRESRDETAPQSVDWAGLGLLSGALFLILFGVTRANDAGWASPATVGCLLTGAMLLPLFIAVERRTRFPLVDLALFRNGTFVMAGVSVFLFNAAVFGSQPYVSLFMQNYWGFSPLEGGLAFVPATALVALLTPVSGISGQRLGPQLRLITIAGSLLVVTSAILILRLNTHSSYAGVLLPAFVLRGIGIGLFTSATSLAVMSAMPASKAGLASGTLTMTRNVGTALGVAVLGAVFLHQVHAALQQNLAATDPAQVARITAAATHFVPAGQGQTLMVARQAIVAGFVRTAAVAALLCALAAGAAFFIRHRLAPASVALREVSSIELKLPAIGPDATIPTEAAVAVT